MESNEIRNRQYFSDFVDMIICFIPAILTYSLTGIQQYYERLGIFEIMAIIYLFYSIIVIITNDGRSIGNILSKTSMIYVNSGNKSVLLYLLRVIIISFIIFSIPEMVEGNYLLLAISLLLFLPIRFKKNRVAIFSLLNRGSLLTFISSVKER